MADTLIEWADKTWNPITGCSKASEACEHCYAERMAKRLAGRYGYPKDEPFRVTLHPDRLNEPLRWKKPSRIFVCSMSDIFHDEVPTEFIDQILDTIESCPQHTFMLLTKRPENLESKLYGITHEHPFRVLGGGDYLENAWLGVTAENQARADERIPLLLQIPAAGYFVSHEPALGPINWTQIMRESDPINDAYIDGVRDHSTFCDDALTGFRAHKAGGSYGPKLDWIIAGGETGPGARPSHPDWFRQDRDQCKAAGVPFFLKQMGRKQPTPEDLLIREMPQ